MVDRHDEDASGEAKTESVEVREIVESSVLGFHINPEISSNMELAEDSAADCRHCAPCDVNFCEDGTCGRSNGNRTGTNDEARPCCATKKKKSILFRKSTKLLFSGFCMLGVTAISIADIATDILTAREYYLNDRITAFILSLVFLIIPPILLTAGIIRRRDDSIRNTTTKTMSCCIKFLIVIANVPLKLYMIWLQLVFAYRCFKRFCRRRKCGSLAQDETLMEGSLSHFITELTLYKLWNSIFESMPQLLLTLHVIMTNPTVLQHNEGYLLIASSAFSFGSLCVGTIFYAIKSKEAETQPVNSRRPSHPLRSKSTVLGFPQISLISIYTVCFLGSRTLSFSYFIIFFDWYAAIVPGLHWIVVFAFFTYRRYINQKNTMHHYRMTTYQRRSSSFVYVFVHSVMSVFIHIKPECEEVLDQPRYYKIIYYLFYAFENCAMMLMPIMVRELPRYLLMDGSVVISDEDLAMYKYYPATYAVMGSLALGCFTCALYHVLVHKSAKFTREQVFGPCCKCCFGPGGFLWFSCSCCNCCRDPDEGKIFVACKNIHTHEICKASLRDIKQWKESTESKLLNKKPLRAWKVLQNEYRGAVRNKDVEAENESNSSETSTELNQDPDCPYTMRRSGLHILSDPQGNLFYAPIADIKAKAMAIS